MVRCSLRNYLFSYTCSNIFLCPDILNLAKSPLPFCARFGCLTNFASAFAPCTIAFKPRKPTCIGHGFYPSNERQVSPATHRQALNALLFLYKQVIQGFSCRMLWKPSTRGLGSRGLGIGCSRTLGLTRSSAGKPLEAKAQQGAGQDDINNISLVFE